MTVSAVHIAATDNDEAAARQKLQLVQSMMQGSEKIQAIEQSDNGGAKSLLSMARQTMHAAEIQLELGAYKQAAQLANETLRLLSGATGRITQKPQQVTSGEYLALRESILAFIGSLENQPSTPGVQERLAQVQEQLDLAQQQRASGEGLKAQETLYLAYNSLVNFISELRDKQTVVHSLNFTSPSEEYEYELRRLKSYQALLQMTRSSGKSTASDDKISEYLKLAETKRAQALSFAESGQMEQAIDSLEGAAKEMSRALRTAGVMVP
ncbi:hypothetical protein D0544_09400 [Aestuariirhabdus litorea]|uniref:Uncharacterized protein n=1 Tax=Aestuariirhabdus litorea TaxID=2528527 RepID=A0A3P3VV03_9GAMM|nr:hypothetical protein D0544_09400 [Aestuariirhabdus litorea]